MVNHPFDEGEIVDIGGASGTVRNVVHRVDDGGTPDNQVDGGAELVGLGQRHHQLATASETRRSGSRLQRLARHSDRPVQAELERTVQAHPLGAEGAAAAGQGRTR